MAIRIWEKLPEKVAILQDVDHVFIQGLKITVYMTMYGGRGVTSYTICWGYGDERTYEKVVASEVESVDGMTATGPFRIS